MNLFGKGIMKYSDFVGYVSFVLSLPIVAIKLVVTTVPTIITVVLSYFKYEKAAANSFVVVKGVSDVFNTIEKYWIYIWSIILYSPWSGASYRNYKQNVNVISFLRENVRGNRLKVIGMPENLVFAIQKEGLFEVCWKMIFMFSILPTFRHAFLNNPFLYRYKLYLTNQSTEEFKPNDIENMCRLVFSYINDPSAIKINDHKLDIQLDDIGFTPNYSNDLDDIVVDYDNYGIQVGGKITTLIRLETLEKTSHELYQTIQDQDQDQTIQDQDQMSSNIVSIMSKTNPIYKQIKDNYNDIEIHHNVEFDTQSRVGILDLIVTYDDYYHLVTGKVEANIRNGNIIEHPMLCLYHDGDIMVKTWILIDSLFNERVMRYLSKKGGATPL